MFLAKSFIFLFLLCAPLFARHPHDFGFWLETLTTKELGEPWRVRVFTSMRYRKNASRNHARILQVNVDYHARPNLYICPGFRNRFDIDDKGRVTQLYSPLIEALSTWQGTIGDILFRPRISYHIPEGFEKNRWENRDYLQWSFTKMKLGYAKAIIPFISDEIFWLEGEGMRENRFQVGLEMQLKHGFKWRPVWLIRALKVERWERDNIFIFLWSYHF